MKVKFPCGREIEVAKFPGDMVVVFFHPGSGPTVFSDGSSILTMHLDTLPVIRDTIDKLLLNVKTPANVIKFPSTSEQLESELEPRTWQGSESIGEVIQHGRD